MMNKNLDTLAKECRDLGLTVVQAGKRLSKDDYIRALQDHYKRKTNDPAVHTMLGIDPMLCFSFHTFDEREKAKFAHNPQEWLVEPKFDGARIIILKIGDSLSFFSRNISGVDYLPCKYIMAPKVTKSSDTSFPMYQYDTDQMTQSAIGTVFEGMPDFVLDAEAIAENPRVDTRRYTNKGCITESYLTATMALMGLDPAQSMKCQRDQGFMKFYVFDILAFNGQDLKRERLLKRKQILTDYFHQVFEKSGGQFVMVPFTRNGAAQDEFYFKYIEHGFEGVIMKNVNSEYELGKRSRHLWVKRKRIMSDFSDIDGFVTGFELGEPGKAWENMVGCLLISVYAKNDSGIIAPQEIAKVSNFDWEERKRMTVEVDGKPCLDQAYYNRVVTIEGQNITARSQRVRHAKLVRYRPDKSPTQCEVDEKFFSFNTVL